MSLVGMCFIMVTCTVRRGNKGWNALFIDRPRATRGGGEAHFQQGCDCPKDISRIPRTDQGGNGHIINQSKILTFNGSCVMIFCSLCIHMSHQMCETYYPDLKNRAGGQATRIVHYIQSTSPVQNFNPQLLHLLRCFQKSKNQPRGQETKINQSKILIKPKLVECV